MARAASTISRAVLVAPSRAFVRCVARLALSRRVSAPSTPTRRIIAATTTSVMVKPRSSRTARADLVTTSTSSARSRRLSRGLSPLAALASALRRAAGHVARAADREVGELRDGEGVAGARVGDDDVGVAGGGDLDLPAAGAHRRARRAVRARVVAVDLRVAGLHGRDDGARVVLGGAVLCLGGLGEEGRERDRREDADDQDDDEELDEREALLGAEVGATVHASLSADGVLAPRAPAPSGHLFKGA